MNCTWTTFSSPDLYDYLAQKKFPAVGQLCYIERACPRTSNHKILRFKCGYIQVMTRGDLMAVVWKDKSDDVMCVKQGA
jgi:hypothetical protein